MDWQFRSLSRVSAHSQSTFEEGERVACLIFKVHDANELGRADVREAELAEFNVEGTLLGRWTRVVKSDAEAAAAARRLTIQSAEELFLSLFTNPSEAGGEVTAAERDYRDALKHLLALLLERKRLLRPIGPRARTGNQTYLHVREKRELAVPILSLSPEILLQVQDVLGELV